MKNQRILRASFLSIPFLLALSSTGERVGYQPKEGASVAKKIVIESNASLDEMSMTMDGQDISSMMGSMEMTINSSQTLAVSDRYIALGEGRPERLQRTFDEISSNTQLEMKNPMLPEGGAMDADVPGSSELEGMSVVFTWNADDDDYDVAFAEGTEGDEELLANLVENIDLREFLPPNEVSPGDTWTLTAQAARDALAPGGSLKIVPEKEGEMSGMGFGNNMSQDELIGELDGDITAEFVGVREEDGKRLAAIKLKLDINSANDLKDKMGDLQEEMPEGMPEMDVQSFDIEYEFKGEGELLWDLEQGLFHSFSISGEIGMIMDIAMSVDVQGDEKSIEQSMTFSGTQSIAMSVGE